MGAMSLFNSLGIGVPRLQQPVGNRSELTMAHRPLRRVMAFLGCSIDQLCNDPIVKNQVFGYFKLYKEINRRGEITELERQWNPAGLRY
jgi:hypothetical protein